MGADEFEVLIEKHQYHTGDCDCAVTLYHEMRRLRDDLLQIYITDTPHGWCAHQTMAAAALGVVSDQ